MRGRRRHIFFIIIILLLGTGIYWTVGQIQNKGNKTLEEQQNQTTVNEKTTAGNKNENKQDYSQQNLQLSKLLPEKENFKWIYNGFAEYGHIMTLRSIDKSADQIKYEINGAVEDMSAGESGRPKDYFDLKITYLIKDGILFQNKSEQAMMDSIFDNVELIRAPLSKNSKWTQKQRDKSGKQYDVECQITDITDENGIKVYTVNYKAAGSYYYETRRIKEGVGLISFQKPWKDESGNQYELGYSLYEEASGYGK